MTTRERNLAMIVGAVVFLVGATWGIRKFVFDPFVNVKRAIVDETMKRGELNRKLAELEDVEKQWQARTARTLAVDPKDAQLKFRENLLMLLERHGLLNDPNSRGTKITPGAITSDRNHFVDVQMTIQASGTLKEIVGFLVDFYRQDYIARIDRLDMQVDQSAMTALERGKAAVKKPGRTVAAAPVATTFGPDGPPLNVNIYASTLVVPPVGKIKPTPLEAIVELETGRLRYPVETYAEIVQRNIFAPYRPPPPIPPPPPPPTQVATPEPTPQPVVKPPEPVVTRDAPERHFLLGTTVLNGEPLAYVKDERDPTKLQKLKLDQPVDDGVLLMIHQRGLVVRVAATDGRRVNYFYPLRAPNPASFAEREELTPDSHPDIYTALEDEFVND